MMVLLYPSMLSIPQNNTNFTYYGQIARPRSGYKLQTKEELLTHPI